MTTAGSSPQRSTLWPLVGLGLLFLLITFNLWWYLGSSEYSCLASENAKHILECLFLNSIDSKGEMSQELASLLEDENIEFNVPIYIKGMIEWMKLLKK